MASREPPPDPITGSPAPVTAPALPARGPLAGCLLVFGLVVTAASLVVLVLWTAGPAQVRGRPNSAETVGLCLAVVTGLFWIATAAFWWRRQAVLALVGTVAALVLGGIAAWLIRQH